LRKPKPACYEIGVLKRFPFRAATLACLALLACQSGPSHVDRETTGTLGASIAAAATARPAAVAAPVQPQIAPPQPTAVAEPTPAAPSPNGVEWHGDIQWHSWTDGLALAKAQSKPIMVLVYADWCPHCRALGPVFADPDIEALAKGLIMVKQNHDENPPWLEPYNEKFGGYVPRIFFFDSNGKMREDLTSGHPRYPYFYAAEAPEYLKRTMRRAVGT